MLAPGGYDGSPDNVYLALGSWLGLNLTIEWDWSLNRLSGPLTCHCPPLLRDFAIRLQDSAANGDCFVARLLASEADFDAQMISLAEQRIKLGTDGGWCSDDGFLQRKTLWPCKAGPILGGRRSGSTPPLCMLKHFRGDTRLELRHGPNLVPARIAVDEAIVRLIPAEIEVVFAACSAVQLDAHTLSPPTQLCPATRRLAQRR